MRSVLLVVVVVCWLLVGCTSATVSPTATAWLVTSTLPPTQIPAVTSSPRSATSSPTTAAIAGTTSTRLNVRGDPTSASAPIGIIDANASVEILGKDPGSNWYQIRYATGKNGVGWVTSQYVNVQNAGSIPILSLAPGSGATGVITQQVFVRSGPATDAGAVGILNARDVVAIVGRDPGGLWLQIQFAGGPEGKGWVAAGYVQAIGLDQLPIVGQSGQTIGTPTPTGVPPTSIPTPAIALDDRDSAEASAANITLSPGGVGTFMYSSDLSGPTGDASDWLGFTPYGRSLGIRLECQPDQPLKVQLTSEGSPIEGITLPTCGSSARINVEPGRTYLLEISFAAAQAGQVYVHYTLTIQSLP